MKQFEPGFEELYEQYGLDSPEKAGELELERSYRRVLEKAGLPAPQPGFRRRTRVLLVAAAVAVAGLCLAAAAYSASDAFRGVLDLRQDPAGTGRNEMFGRIGTMTTDKAVDAGVEISLRAAVCDDRQLRILLDISDPEGRLPAVNRPDGTITMGDLMLRDFQLDKVGDDPGGGYSARYDLLSLTETHATLLLHFNVAESQVRGEAFTLTVRDIMQWGYRDGTALDMEADVLYRMVSQIVAADLPLDEDFQEMSSLLYGDKGFEFPIGNGDIAVTNAVIFEETLYLVGRGDPDTLDRLLENVILKNTATGEESEYRGGSRGGTNDGDIMSWWTLEFEGVTSPEDLRGFVWYYDAGDGIHPVIEGRWELTVHADVEDTAITVEPAQDVVWEGHPMKVKSLEVSPLGVYLVMETDPDTAQAMFDVEEGAVFSSWRAESYPLTIKMKDGTSMEADAPHTGGTDNMWQEAREFYMQYSFDAVIDPEQIESVLIGEAVVRVNH